MAEREKELPRGFVLNGRYEVLQKLGEGSFSSVYRVHDSSLDTECAVKILHRWAGADRKLVERFKREVLYSRRIVHQGCCQVFDFFESANVAMLVMELVPGWTCDDLLIKRGPLPLDAAMSLVAQTAASIAVLHRNDIVHRDIKAENLMITPQGRVKVLDLGMSWSSELSSLTAAGAVLGTPAYMAPEFIQGGSPTPRSDVYSFGVLSYYVLAGQLPFQAVELARLLALQIKEEPASLRRHRADLPKAVDELVLRCLRKDPAERPKDMVELESAWIGILGGAPDPAPLQAVVRSLGTPLAAEVMKAKNQPAAAEPKVAKGATAAAAHSQTAATPPAAQASVAKTAPAAHGRDSKSAPGGQVHAAKPEPAARTPATKLPPAAPVGRTTPPKGDASASRTASKPAAPPETQEVEDADSGPEPAYDSFTDLIIGALGPSREKTDAQAVSPKPKGPAVPASWTKPKPAPRGSDVKRAGPTSPPQDPDDSAGVMTQVLRIGSKPAPPSAAVDRDPHHAGVPSKPAPASTVPYAGSERTGILGPSPVGQSPIPPDSPDTGENPDSGTLQVSIPSVKPAAPPQRQLPREPPIPDPTEISDSGTLQVSIASVKPAPPPQRQLPREPPRPPDSPDSGEISEGTLQVSIPSARPPAAPPRQAMLEAAELLESPDSGEFSERTLQVNIPDVAPSDAPQASPNTPVRRATSEPAQSSRKTSGPSASALPPPPSLQAPPESPQRARAEPPPRQPVPTAAPLEESSGPFEPPSPDSGPTGIAAAMETASDGEDSAEVTAIRTSPIELRKRSNRVRALVVLLIVMVLVTTVVFTLVLLRTPQAKGWLDTLRAIVRLLKG